jgi:hypothetical protein
MPRIATMTFVGLVAAALALIGGTTAGAQPTPTAPAPSPAPIMAGGVEGTKAALVRVEVSAIVEIVHINHSTGDVLLSRGRYTVPISTGTGVFLSSDGVIATAGRNVLVDENKVAIYAANELFKNELNAQLVGNNGDPALPTNATDHELDEHLHHCYQRVEHCVLFTVPQYQVFPFTSPESSAPAELVNQPGGPTDAALLRIAGGGGTPTALLQDASAPPASAASLMGFTDKPAPDRSAVAVPVDVDAASGHLNRPSDLNGQLFNGLLGGPVVDDASGNVLGVATVDPGGLSSLIPATALRDALAGAGVQPTGSPFDAVFRRGVDHLLNGGMGGSAVSAFGESLDYYNSALAAQYLQRAQNQGGGGGQMQMPSTDAASDPASSSNVWWVLGLLAGILLLAGAALLGVRARRSGSPWTAPLHSLVQRMRWHPPGQDLPGGTGGCTPASGEAPDAADVEPVRSGRTVAPGNPDTEERTRSDRVLAATVSSSTRPAPAVGPASPLASHPPTVAPSSINGARPAYCIECGAQLSGRGRFCGACGTSVE